MWLLSVVATVADGVNKRCLTLLDLLDRTLERRLEVIGVLKRPL